MNDFIWETFDSIFQTLQRHDKRFVELEARVVELERRLSERVTLKEVPSNQSAFAVERGNLEMQDELREKRAA
ncbi:MAG: hypothetical protein NVSMB56_04420 [Pyrinomonadaceae bacterium]